MAGPLHSALLLVALALAPALAIGATLDAPDEAEAGSTIAVRWNGPDGATDDWLSVTTPGGGLNRDSFVTLAPPHAPGKPAPLRMPGVPGDYELVYIVNPGREVVARRPIVITPSSASVSAPASVKAGSDIPVRYVGPGFTGDRVVLVVAGAADDEMWGVAANAGFAVAPNATTGTIPGRLTAKPGEYEVRYVTGKQHQVLARQRLLVTPSPGHGQPQSGPPAQNPASPGVR